MAKGYHRLSFRARHVLRQFGKAKNITLQRLHLHELRHAISRKHGFRGPKGKPKLGQPGLYQRLSRKGRQLVARLRHSRSWQVQKQTVNELEREVARGERVALARTRRAERRSQRAERMAARMKDRGRKFRKSVQRAHEPHLARAERKQAARATGTRKPSLRTRATRNLRGQVKSLRRAPQARPQRFPQPARATTPRTPRPLRPAARPPRPRVARTRLRSTR